MPASLPKPAADLKAVKTTIILQNKDSDAVHHGVSPLLSPHWELSLAGDELPVGTATTPEAATGEPTPERFILLYF